MTAGLRSIGAPALLMLLLTTATAAQVTPPRDARRPGQEPGPAGAAEISGVVMMAGSTQPARKTIVRLSGAELRGGRTATTDDMGRFSFPALPAGRYSLSASRPGHVTVSFGQRYPGRPGTQIELSDGQKFRADMQIPRGSVITGTVLDEHGEPAPQTPVRVMRLMTANGERTVGATNTGTTDDRGIYRIFNLMPGDYVVCATPRNTGMPDAQRMQVELSALQGALAQAGPEQAQAMRERMAAIQSTLPAGEDEPPPGYAPICYPGTISSANASVVTLGISEERTAIDFQLQLAPLATIQGTVVNATGAALNQVNVTLSDALTPGTSMLTMSARADNEGRFRINNVPPGQYRVTARATMATPRQQADGRGGRGGGGAPPPRLPPLTVWGAADVSVDGRNLSNVLLSLQQGVSVSGHIAFQGTTLPPPTDLTRMRVTLSPVGRNHFGGASSAQVDAGGRFTLPGVPPGRYRFNATGAAGWTTDSATIGGQDAMDFPFEVKGSENINGVSITMTDRRTELTGTVVDDRNRPAVDYTIVIFPADPRYWESASRRIQSARPSTDGQFTFRNLPPGEYRIATPLDIEAGALTDPAVLQQLESSSMRVTLQPGESKVQNIRLSGG